VAIGRSIATPFKYPKLFDLNYTDMMIAQFRLWPDKPSSQKEILIYASSLATHLNAIFLTKIPHLTPASTINLICREWDYTTKRRFAKVLAAIDDEHERTRIHSMIMQTWVDFVEMMRAKQKKSRCRLCHERLEKEKDKSGVDWGLVDHVMTKHRPPRIWEEQVDEEIDGIGGERAASEESVLARRDPTTAAGREVGGKFYKGG
jgi:hypothetical protein